MLRVWSLQSRYRSASVLYNSIKGMTRCFISYKLLLDSHQVSFFSTSRASRRANHNRTRSNSLLRNPPATTTTRSAGANTAGDGDVRIEGGGLLDHHADTTSTTAAVAGEEDESRTIDVEESTSSISTATSTTSRGLGTDFNGTNTELKMSHRLFVWILSLSCIQK